MELFEEKNISIFHICWLVSRCEISIWIKNGTWIHIGVSYTRCENIYPDRFQ